MKKTVAIYDRDHNYARRLAETLSRRENSDFAGISFTTPERLMEYERNHPIDMILVHETALSSAESAACPVVVGLSEERDREAAEPGESRIYKYQSADRLVRELSAAYCTAHPARPVPAGDAETRIWGLCSVFPGLPVSCLGMALAESLAEKGSTLYLRLGRDRGLFSCLGLEESEKDISDVFYYCRQRELDRIRLQSLTVRWRGADFIRPFAFPEDLEGRSGQEAGEVLESLRRCGYERIVCEIGPEFPVLQPILQQCDRILLLSGTDSLSRSCAEKEKERLSAQETSFGEKLFLRELPETDGQTDADRLRQAIGHGVWHQRAAELIGEEETTWRKSMSSCCSD